MRKNSIKSIRINREFQRELSTLISLEIKDPRISPMTSVVSVEVAPDLKTSKIYISVLGGEEEQKSTLAGLKSAAPFLRAQLAHNLNLRNTPELSFYVDQSIEYGVTMSHRIDEVIEADARAAALADRDDYDEGSDEDEEEEDFDEEESDSDL